MSEIATAEEANELDRAVSAMDGVDPSLFDDLRPAEPPAEEASEAAPEAAASAEPEQPAEPLTREQLEAELAEYKRQNADYEKQNAGLRGAVSRERSSRRQADDRLAQLTPYIQQAMQAPAQQPPPESDDPLERIENNQALMNQRLDARDQEEAQRQQVARQQQYEANLVRAAVQAQEDFRGTVPDYDGAFSFVERNVAAFLQNSGTPEDQIPHVIRSQFMQLTQNAFQSRQNPAELIYRQAEQMGWKPAAPAAAEAPDSVADAAAPAATRSPATPAPRQAPGSLSTVPRTTGRQAAPTLEEQVSADNINRMVLEGDDDAFRDFMRQLEAQAQ